MLTPNFTATQNSGTPSYITLQDTSSGSDVSIVSRRIYMLQSDGTYLVPDGNSTDYVIWAIASSTISLQVLTQDTALSITVDWVDVNGDVVETKTTAYGFQAFGETFFYGLTKNEVPITNPNVALSTNYYQNKLLLRVYLDSAEQAISFASDIYAAQVAYDSETFLIANANFNF